MEELQYWMGTEASLNALHEKFKSLPALGHVGGEEDDDEDEPQLFQLIGNVGVVNIAGSLTNRDAWYNSFIGLTSYTSICNAVIDAITHPQVEHVLLNIDSTGGTAAGVSDAGAMIRKLSGIKPITAFTSGNMMSAAMWLGASAPKVYASATGMVGSIGVIQIHQDVSKMLADEGIKATVLRAGDKKARLNPYEPLTKTVKDGAEATLAHLHALFIDHIAEMRGYGADYVREKMADGSEFVAGEAVPIGLIDGVTTFDDLMAELQADGQKRAEARQPKTQMPLQGRNLMMEANMAKRKVLDAETVAKLASGMSVDQVLEEAPEAQAETAAETSESQAEAAPVVVEQVAGVLELRSDGDFVSYLKTELAEKNAQVVELQVKLNEAERRLDSVSSVHDQLMDVARERVAFMHVAIGGPAPDLSGFGAEALLAQYAKTNKLFQATYPVGGVTAQPSANHPEKTVQHTAVDRARLRAVKSS